MSKEKILKEYKDTQTANDKGIVSSSLLDSDQLKQKIDKEIARIDLCISTNNNYFGAYKQGLLFVLNLISKEK